MGINCAPVNIIVHTQPHFEVFKNGSLKSDVLTLPEMTEVWEITYLLLEKLLK